MASESHVFSYQTGLGTSYGANDPLAFTAF
jgi:hypothetical protein